MCFINFIFMATHGVNDFLHQKAADRGAFLQDWFAIAATLPNSAAHLARRQGGPLCKWHGACLESKGPSGKRCTVATKNELILTTDVVHS